MEGGAQDPGGVDRVVAVNAVPGQYCNLHQ